MKALGVPFKVLALVVLVVVLPPVVSAQDDASLVRVGDTVKVERYAAQASYVLEAEEGQTVTLRWEATARGSRIMRVTTEIVNADGAEVPSIRQLDTTTTSDQVVLLTGPAPYRVSARIQDGMDVTLAVLEGDPITALEQPPIGMGETVAGVIPAPGELIVYPLDVQPGEVFTVFASGPDPRPDGDAGLNYPWTHLTLVRDASGRVMEPDLRTNGRVYTATGTPPFRLEMARYAWLSASLPSATEAEYSIRLEAGNTAAVEGTVLPLGQRVEGVAPGDVALIYTFDAEEGDSVTLHLDTDWNYLWDVGRPLDGGRYELIRPVWSLASDSGDARQRCTCVYQLSGPPPYALFLILQIYAPHMGLDYAVQLDEGDTLVRNRLGALSPGGMVQGTVPVPDGTLTYYALDVDPNATIALNWGTPDIQYFVHEASGEIILPLNNGWTDGYVILDLSTGMPPFVLEVNRPEARGQSYFFTLAQGATPLSPNEATLIPSTLTVERPVSNSEPVIETGSGPLVEPGSDTVTGDSATSGAGACMVTANANVNQRGGPGTTFDVSGTLTAGSTASADGQTTGADGLIWYRLTTGSWVRSDVVTAEPGCSALPTVS